MILWTIYFTAMLALFFSGRYMLKSEDDYTIKTRFTLIIFSIMPFFNVMVLALWLFFLLIAWLDNNKNKKAKW